MFPSARFHLEKSGWTNSIFGGDSVLGTPPRRSWDAASDDDHIPPGGLAEDEKLLCDPFGNRYLYKRVLHEAFEPKSERIRCFDLFDETSNPFLDFANAPATSDGAKALADRFGPLQEGPQLCEDWYRAIHDIRSAVAVWDQAKATKNFGPIIREVAERVMSQSYTSLELVGEGLPANILLISDKLGEPRLSIRLPTLADALWTALAMAVDGSEALQTCGQCKKWFTLKAGRGRSDKEYCSNACRMRAYRKRKGKK